MVSMNGSKPHLSVTSGKNVSHLKQMTVIMPLKGDSNLNILNSIYPQL